ncbi:MAG: hypothetical protein WBB70_12575 [Desulfobacterales bacterium]
MATPSLQNGSYRPGKPLLDQRLQVKMDLILPKDKFKIGKRVKTHIDVSGSVIRTEQQGMAVCFDKKYYISPVE